jgi:hypothetical protein
MDDIVIHQKFGARSIVEAVLAELDMTQRTGSPLVIIKCAVPQMLPTPRAMLSTSLAIRAVAVLTAGTPEHGHSLVVRFA